MRRGDLHLADLGQPVDYEQALRRPVLLVSAAPWLLSDPPVITILPLTRSQRSRSTHVEIEPGASGLTAPSYAECEDIRAVSPLRFERRMGQVNLVTMARIDLILGRLLAL
ncbi:type II toxin-antitoxin system PemK/MazF family toxin [uncultured Friedmanniella sp.]|uniref:type II toxin-antitoxin system PemK/MazF family toxin n=1 Tax=uncultured Friedmanniella sp. TaxID=335381 RepID=UPI0035CB832E